MSFFFEGAENSLDALKSRVENYSVSCKIKEEFPKLVEEISVNGRGGAEVKGKEGKVVEGIDL